MSEPQHTAGRSVHRAPPGHGAREKRAWSPTRAHRRGRCVWDAAETAELGVEGMAAVQGPPPVQNLWPEAASLASWLVLELDLEQTCLPQKGLMPCGLFLKAEVCLSGSPCGVRAREELGANPGFVNHELSKAGRLWPLWSLSWLPCAMEAEDPEIRLSTQPVPG